MSWVTAHMVLSAFQPTHLPPVQVPVRLNMRRFSLTLAIMSSADVMRLRYLETLSPVRVECFVTRSLYSSVWAAQ
jgi:hypothetical protein